MKAFALFASFAAPTLADKPDYEGMWLKFKADYNKHYESNGNEEQKRLEVFKANVDVIEEHNAKKLSYWLGANEFADLTWDEFSSTHLGLVGKSSRLGGKSSFPENTTADVVDSIDWVAKGAVTPVKNQKHCGSCWAFSATGALEGAYFVASGKLVSLSEEDLVQCDLGGDHGCGGGLMDNAFEFVEKTGISSEADYPYTSGSGATGSCKRNLENRPAVTIKSYIDVPSRDENALKAAASKQPVAVAIEADRSAFQLYRGGILDNPGCGQRLDHGVLLVGYGTDSGKDYWKVKNSWGASWGEQGYIRMVRNKNQCGISNMASYPTGAQAPPTPASGMVYTQKDCKVPGGRPRGFGLSGIEHICSYFPCCNLQGGKLTWEGEQCQDPEATRQNPARCWQSALWKAEAICNRHSDCNGVTRDIYGYEPRGGAPGYNTAQREMWLKETAPAPGMVYTYADCNEGGPTHHTLRCNLHGGKLTWEGEQCQDPEATRQNPARCWQSALWKAEAICNRHSDCVGVTRDSNGYEPRGGAPAYHPAAREMWLKETTSTYYKPSSSATIVV